MGLLPAEMPKIKAGASGRCRERQQQRRELKSVGGGDRREGAGVSRVGSSGRTEPGVRTEFWAGTVRPGVARALGAAQVPGFPERGPQARRAASGFLSSRRGELKLSSRL